MIESPAPNVKLTLEQLQQLEIMETRLGNLQSEIKIASKALVAATNDCARITNEKDYQQGLAINLASQNIESQAQLKVLDERKIVVSEELSTLNQTIAVKTDVITRKEMEIKDREDSISSREKDVIAREESVSLREQILENDNLSFKEKVAKIRQAISNA